MLELFSFLEILKDEGVEVSLASDLELDLIRFLMFLDARRCRDKLN